MIKFSKSINKTKIVINFVKLDLKKLIALNEVNLKQCLMKNNALYRSEINMNFK